jgi:hypothetical protein
MDRYPGDDDGFVDEVGTEGAARDDMDEGMAKGMPTP